MDADTSHASKAPWHLWVVGILSLLWNAMGALDFAMTQSRNEAWLKSFTPEQIEWFLGFPFWVMLTWGIATWGSLVAAVLLLLRKRLAVTFYTITLVAMVLTTIHNYGFSNASEIMGGTGPLIFSVVIFVVSVLELVYARALRQRGVLHG